jgi:CARDB
VTDPNARFFDRNLGSFVQGPLKSRIFVQIPGEKPDLNENGVDDAIDIADGTCTDENGNGVCDHVEPGAFKYSAKLICGVQDDPDDIRLVQGLYATAINILNPNEKRARFTKKLALTYPPGEQKPGRVLLIGEDELGSDEGLEVDCLDIRRKLFPNGYPTPYIKGFVVITSNMSLDVTAVYTSRAIDTGKRCRKAKHDDDYCRMPPRHCKARHGRDCGKPAASGDISIDVEQIHERKPEPKEPPARLRPDLVVRDIGQPSVRCQPGKGMCRTGVHVTVANVGSGNAGPFNLRVVFDPAQSVIVDVPVAGLTAGAQQTLSVTTPPGGNCFDPDCTITVTADSTNAVEESDEGNNRRSETTPG